METNKPQEVGPRPKHEAAMKLYKQAKSEKEATNINWQKTLEQAFILEKEAAYMLLEKKEAEPTRGVLFKSAASMAFDLKLYNDAKELIQIALAGKPDQQTKTGLENILNEISKKQTLN